MTLAPVRLVPLPGPAGAVSGSTRPASSREAERGFGLVESLMALGVAATGLLAIAGLMAAGANLQQKSREGGRSGNAAVRQMEVLRILPSTDARVQIGGSLISNEADHNTLVNVPPAGQVRVRWVVAAGPANSREFTVRAEPTVQGSRVSEVRSLVWFPDAVPQP